MTAPLLLAYIGGALLLQLAVWISVSRWRRTTAEAIVQPPAPADARSPNAWAGWRDFRVTRREPEDPAQTQCSLYLQPVDGALLPPFVPGQFLTFALPVSDGRTLTRCYSLSDGPNASGYRISVKRVLAPAGRPQLPSGEGSRYLHDQLQLGDIVKVKAPAGRFVVEGDASESIVLIAGGIGITPLLSMLRGGLAEKPNRAVYLFYGVRQGAEHGFKKELEELARQHSSFHLNAVYSEPGPLDTLGQHYQHAGFINIDLLRRTLPAGRHAFYVCGPPPMMATLIPALRQWGVRAEDIHYEAFGPASTRSAQTSSLAQVSGAAPSLEVFFRKSGRTLTWDGKDANLLDFAERHDVAVESGCRSGSCGNCEVRLISGTVRYADKPDHEISSGHCLLCVGAPESALELEA